MGLKPAYSSGFDIPEEGDNLFSVDTLEFKTDEEKGLTCAIKNIIVESDTPENVGMTTFDNFPLYKEFAVKRLLGFLVKATKMPEDLSKEMGKSLGVTSDGDGYPPNFFEVPKVRVMVEKKAKGAVFGGTIKHTKGQKGMFANIKEYYAKEEFREKVRGTPVKHVSESEIVPVPEGEVGPEW